MEEARTELERLRAFRHAVVNGTHGGSLSGDETKRVVMSAIHALEARTKEDTGSFAMEDPEGEGGWKTVLGDGYAERHRKHLVRREGRIALCTPCYGMHAPWWVEMTLEGNELEPIQVLPTDEHMAYEVVKPLDPIEKQRALVARLLDRDLAELEGGCSDELREAKKELDRLVDGES